MNAPMRSAGGPVGGNQCSASVDRNSMKLLHRSKPRDVAYTENYPKSAWPEAPENGPHRARVRQLICGAQPMSKPKRVALYVRVSTDATPSARSWRPGPSARPRRRRHRPRPRRDPAQRALYQQGRQGAQAPGASQCRRQEDRGRSSGARRRHRGAQDRQDGRARHRDSSTPQA
jgi:hypothetical protein